MFRIKTQLLLLLLLTGIQRTIAQKVNPEPEKELALSLKVVTGKIIYGASSMYITEPGSVYLQPGLRYGYPIKIAGKNGRPRYLSLAMQAGFLFCRAKRFDSLYFNPRNPSYLPVSIGLYSLNAFSAGTELFYAKGLGNRDIWGAKLISLGYNGRQCRLYGAAEYYMQTADRRKNGLFYSVEFAWKLISDR